LKYRKEIDGLRAVAVASVLLFHLGFSTFSGGFVGVDVFFVISGYLITGIISDEVAETGTFDFGNFYLRRLRRLFPALLATVAISLPFAFWLLSPLNFREFGGSAFTAIISASNIYFWSLVDYFNTANITKPLLHTWSLSVEEQFYLVWPALITFLTLRKWPVSFFLIALGAVSLLANLPLTLGHVSTIFYWMPFRVFEFVLGAIVLWLPAVESSKTRSMLSLVGLALIATAVVTYTEKTIFPSVRATAPCLGAACVIYGGINFAANALLGNALSVFVGKISYSLYLVHWPLIVFYRYYIFEPPTLDEQLCLLILSISGACVLHFAVERPFINEPSMLQTSPSPYPAL
jgi:peptidoglycan/LPS O-acetylase OafA/YrhL